MATLTINNPATEKIIAEHVSDDETTIAHKFEKAVVAQRGWKEQPLSHRINVISRFQSLLNTHLQRFAKDLTLETGKPISQARGELTAVQDRIAFFCHAAPLVLNNEVVSAADAAVTEMIEHEPLGVVANISAWNYPYFTSLNVIIPALLAGNAVLYKPSEYAPLSGLHLVETLTEAGIAPDLIPVFVGAGAVGEALLDLPVDGVFFTGSARTGQKILKQLNGRMIHLQLELGGKDGIYVCDDANLAFAVPSIAEGAFYNTGQGCCSVERIFVQRSIYEDFKAAFIKTVAAYTVGDPAHEMTFVGPLTRPAQVTFLEDQVHDATKRGEAILLGGHRLNRTGSYFAPTIIECKGTDARVMQEESFGPIVAIQAVENDQEAIQKLNAGPYGLTAGVYSTQQDRAIAILKQVAVGSAYWNCCDRVSPRLPWSGRKGSGIGSTLSTEGIRCFTRSKAWFFRQH